MCATFAWTMEALLPSVSMLLETVAAATAPLEEV